MLEHESSPNFTDSLTEILRIVWSYIENTRSSAVKEDLKSALIQRLIEIAKETPCATGIANRLINTPVAIDFSLGATIPRAQLREELGKLASDINTGFEEEWGQYADQARQQFEAGTLSVNPDTVISEIKREMFIAKASALYVDLWGIDSALVLEEANKVFPQGMVL